MKFQRIGAFGLALSAAFLLVTTALKTGTLIENPQFLNLTDAVLGTSLKTATWIGLLVESSLLLCFLIAKSQVVCSAAFLAFSISGLVYHWQRIQREQLFCPCLGNLGSWIGFDRSSIAAIAVYTLLFILVISSVVLFSSLRSRLRG